MQIFEKSGKDPLRSAHGLELRFSRWIKPAAAMLELPAHLSVWSPLEMANCWQMDQRAASFSFQIQTCAALNSVCSYGRHLLDGSAFCAKRSFRLISAGTRAAPSAAGSVTVTAMALRTSVQRSSTPAPLLTPCQTHPWDPDATLLLWWDEKPDPTVCDNFWLFSFFFLFLKAVVKITTKAFTCFTLWFTLYCVLNVSPRPQKHSTDITSVIKMQLKRDAIVQRAATVKIYGTVYFQKMTRKLPEVQRSLTYFLPIVTSVACLLWRMGSLEMESFFVFTLKFNISDLNFVWEQIVPQYSMQVESPQCTCRDK